jgi:TPR repeat protein
MLPGLLQSADQGNAAAKRDLGLAFLHGSSDLALNPVLALQWFENASLHGDVRSASYVGDFYLDSKNAPIDVDSARFWYMKARKAHDARGTIALAALLCHGTGTSVDLPLCGSLLDEAAKDRLASDPEDVVSSLKEYDLQLGVVYHTGEGVPQRQTLAANWFAKAALLGSVPAALAESRLYVEPGGLPQNLPKAIVILDAVTNLALDGSVPTTCESASFDGLTQVIALYTEIGAKYEARGPGSFPQAMEAYRKAAALGDGAPIIALGLRYANGKGVPRDLDKAQTILLGLTKSSSIKREDHAALSKAIRTLVDRIAARKNPADAGRIALLRQAAEREIIVVCPAASMILPPEALPLPPVERYPNLQAPDTVAPLQSFTVQVSLNTIQFDTSTQILNGAQDHGQLQFTLPEGLTSMPIDVALIAPGMTFAPGTTNTATLVLDASNANSTPATFQVQAPSAPRATKLIATLSYHQTFLAQIARNITITAAIADSTPAPKAPIPFLAPPETGDALTRSDQSAISDHTQGRSASPAPPGPGLKLSSPGTRLVTELPPKPNAPVQQPIVANPTGQMSDLTIIETLVGDSMSYQILGPGIDPTAPSIVLNAAATRAKVQSDYSQLQSQAMLLAAASGAQCAADRAAKPFDNGSDSDANCADAMFSRGLIEGIGTDLYTHDAPDTFRTIYQQMLSAHMRLHSITIVTNTPLLPWELMCVPSPTGKGCNLLGLTTAIVRENSAAPQLAQPADIPFSAIDIVAPNYTGTLALAGAAAELKSIKATFPIAKRVDGDANSVSLMVKAAPEGIIHFTGHGKRVENPGHATPATASTPALTPAASSALTPAADSIVAAPPPLLAPRVAIALEDYDMTPDTFIAFRAEGDPAAHPFYFFNACDLGQSDKELSYVAGWGPALMRSGAAGYLGALYEVGDASATRFAAHFYAGLKANLASNRPWTMAELVTQARQQTYAESNDPTALAYVLYAKPFMKLVAGR